MYGHMVIKPIFVNYEIKQESGNEIKFSV